MHATLRTRLAPGLLAGALVLVPLAGCSFTSNGFSCSGSSCTVTLDGEGSEVDILGQTVTLGGVQDGRATISVGGASVSCGEGESGTAGPLAPAGASATRGASRRLPPAGARAPPRPPAGPGVHQRHRRRRRAARQPQLALVGDLDHDA